MVLFECLTGSRPFDRDNPVRTALAHLRDPVPALPERVPRRLAEVTRTALAKHPGQRYADGDRFATALREAALGGGTMLPAGPPPVAATTAETPAGTTRRRLPAWWPLTLLAALALAVLVAVRDGGSGSATAPDTPSSTPSARTAVLVNGSRYVGMDAARAGRLLRDLGLRPQAVTVANHGSHRPGTVAGVSPTGRVPLRQAVTVRSWGPRPAPHRSGEKAEPPQPPKHSKPGKHAPGKHGHHDKPGHGGDTGKQNGKGHHD